MRPSLAINNKGQVIGAAPTGSTYQAWMWQNGNITYLGSMGNAGSCPVALNNAGQVIGYTINANNTMGPWFIWQNGVMSTISGLPDAGELAAINDSGQIAGDGMTPLDQNYATSQQAFIWQNGVATFLGCFSSPTALWQLSRETDINNQGQVVGTATKDTGDTPFGIAVPGEYAFMWQDGVMTDLGTLGGTYSIAYAINDNGWIVGTSETADGQYHAVLWTPVPEPSCTLGVLVGLLLVFRRPRSFK